MAGNISFVRIVEGFELCQLSERIQFFHRMRFSVGRTIYCYCGTCLFLSEQVRQLNEKRFVFTIPFFIIKKGTKNTPRVSVWLFKIAKSHTIRPKWDQEKRRQTYFPPFTTESLSMGPLENHRCRLKCTEEFCLRMDAFAAEDHSYLATRADLVRFDDIWGKMYTVKATIQHNLADVDSWWSSVGAEVFGVN